ncbi:hypothetical protein PGTUg99_035413 [Puccinia graminis f. sp. tritici]|uniref:Uncharacterized protein n=1 Tax=Puccinia graminis f. sp. tritici TaxID=56615 RepID=A0A5B0RV39_PUCGR|nr:hypothetical protein PGTUg99_035413 [Puccinia graminis f. sp. tritici]
MEIFISDECSETSGPENPPYSFDSNTTCDSAPSDASTQHQNTASRDSNLTSLLTLQRNESKCNSGTTS